jgi:cobyric acid synthase
LEGTGSSRQRKEQSYDRLAETVRQNVKMELVYQIMGLK